MQSEIEMTGSTAGADGRGTPADERGIALLLVLIVLLLTSILALEIKSTAALHSRMARNQRDDFLVHQVMRGQVEILKQVLLLDQQEGPTDALDDRWTDEKYTSRPGTSEEDVDTEEPISSDGVSLEVRIEDESRKFNLFNLIVEDEALREHWKKVFLRLVDLYRDDYDNEHNLSDSEARTLLEKLEKWLAREKESKGIPVPDTANENQIMITPDELLMVEGFTREILYDRAPENEGEEPIPGLLRYLTLWSDGRVNLNTADPVVVWSLFTELDKDAADNFLSWREEEAEEQPENRDPDLPGKKNRLTGPQDLMSIDGFDTELVQRNRLGDTITVQTQRFSIHLLGQSPDGIRRQERWVIERNAVGFTTLLYEERNDPVYGEEEE